MILRDAVKNDVKEILDIYNEAIVNSVSTFHTEEQSLGERNQWFDEHGKDHPILILELDGHVAAWGSLSMWNPKPAYNGTAELTLYVNKVFRGGGLGNAMMEALLDKAKSIGLHTLISLITSSNEASLCLHKKWSFSKVGVLKESGFKFNQYHDVDIWQIIL
ncbi:N-acetyltransferase family protein [Oceanispirochaeta crateris]|uniref:N-acetyltransferase family protein n=1 Tax=Oceanispirochaeta crateris TaxID=2518645 RepID=A0A5C1QMX7_9SPIO|nr:GNAT family N-acetyltransferase [Oceanispirochaeta crateris]QEN08310.1 N-acetyltransferase family protein [Oceanispirochaeta crateris]